LELDSEFRQTIYRSKLRVNMGGFDDLLAELEGTGWFQNRIAWFLIGPLFFIMPFVFLNQVFVLFVPGK